jgi:Uma2 family endonuclease
MAVALSADFPVVPAAWWDDFEDPPGYRAEVIRGELVLSPSPGRPHQRALRELLRILSEDCPKDYEVLPDIEWRLDRRGVVAQAPRPDLVVVRTTDGPVTEPPLLAVEILSRADEHRLQRAPMSRLAGKQLDYAENGLQHLLLVTTQEPEAQLLVPTAGGWDVVATAAGSETFLTREPFALTFRPIDLG